MTAPPAAASAPSAPGPVPPPVCGAPAGKPVLLLVPSGASLVLDPVGKGFVSPVGKGCAVPVGPAVLVGAKLADGDPVGKLVPVPLGEAEHEGDGVAEAVADVLGLPDVLGLADALGLAEAGVEVLGETELDGAGLVVAVQLGAGDGLHDGGTLADAVAELLALAVALAEAEVLGEVLGDGLWVGAQLDVAAAATPPNGPVSASTATEASRAAAPDARPASPARCSCSQLICRDRRKIVLIPRTAIPR